jgi:hypothetical protein
MLLATLLVLVRVEFGAAFVVGFGVEFGVGIAARSAIRSGQAEAMEWHGEKRRIPCGWREYLATYRGRSRPNLADRHQRIQALSDLERLA